MKYFTSKTKQLFIISIFMLSSFVFFSPLINAKDLIEVVLDETLDFESNNGNLPHTKIYKEFNTPSNLSPIDLFDLATDFPVNIDSYFIDSISQVKLKINQSNFANIKKNQPENLLINIPVANGKNFTLALQKNNPISNNFQFKDAEGNLIAFDKGLHYHGIVSNNSTSWAAVSIFDNYVRALFIDYEGIYVLSAVNHFDEHYLLYNDKKLAVTYFSNLSCAVDDEDGLSGQKLAPDNTQANRNANTTIDKTVQISIECDYAMFEHQGNFQNVYNYVTATLNEAAILFENDDVLIELSEIVAWGTEDMYNDNITSTVLHQFSARRQNNFNGDLLHLFTSEHLDKGGLANVNVLGKCYTFYPKHKVNYGPYGLSVVDYWICTFGLYHYDVWTFVHEIGHNLGSRHTHHPVWEVGGLPGQALDNSNVCNNSNIACFDHEAPIDEVEKTGGTIMSYYITKDFGTSFYRGFGNQPGQVIRSNIDVFFNKGCTDVSACNFDSNATQDDGTCIFGNAMNDDSIFEDIPWLNGKVNKDTCSYESIIVYKNVGESDKNVLINIDGCIEIYDCEAKLTYSSAPDFNTIEILNLWTCRDCNGNKKGCMYTNACNYNPQATVNKGLCDFGASTCPDACDNDCSCLSLLDLSNNKNVFNKYTWLADSINYDGMCNFKKITEYDFSSNQFLNIEFNDGTAKLFSGDGQFNCTTSLCENCLEAHVPNPNTANITCYTCGETEEICDATGIVKYQICDEGQSYFLIETTDGSIIEPNNPSGTNFNFQNGEVVQFGYANTFTTSCGNAAYGVYLTCIKSIELPCTNTGTVFTENCEGTTHTLINMEAGGILDPYLSPTVNFDYEEGAFVEFAYMPVSYSPCSIALQSGIITCIQNTCSNNMRTINSVPIPNGIHSNAKHLLVYGEVHASSNVVLKAPKITMQTGFKVEAGATFKAVNSACE